MAAPDNDANDEKARARARALLEAVHQFPGEYAVTVIAFNRDTVTEAIRGAARRPPAWDEGAAGDGIAAVAITSAAIASGAEGQVAPGEQEVFASYEVRPSKEGKYLSHRFTVRVTHAGEVLDLYARLRALEGVLTIL